MAGDLERIPPEDCASLEEIREGMDAIDREVVSLLAQRVEYVRAAAKFKTSSAGVAAPERVAAVLKTRREWAEAAGLEGELIETLYRQIVDYCVAEEHRRWRKING